MKKKCLLVSPPDIGLDLPRGLLELASFLEVNGVPTSVLLLAHELDGSVRTGGRNGPIDERETELVLRDAIRRANPAVVGVSNQHTVNYPDCLAILEICKRIDGNIVTVIGGHHVTFQDVECAASPFVDVVVRGEGEWTLLELISTVEQGKDLAALQGITFEREGKVIRTPDRPLGDLRELPPVDYGLLPSAFLQRAAIYGALSRGCSFDCAFCAESSFWRTRRVHPVQRLIDEMVTLQQAYGRSMDAIEGSMIAIGSKQSLELCSELVRNKIDLSPGFYIYSRVDTITDEGLEALKSAGIYNIWIGIETASAQVLRMMKKRIGYDQTVEACRRLRDNGINAGSLWVIGHPGDNPQEAAHSLSELKRLYAQQLIKWAQAALFIPYPGTPFFDHPESYGIAILTFDWRRWDRWSGHPIHELKDFTAEQIAAFYQKSVAVVQSQERIESYLQRPSEYRKRPSDGDGIPSASHLAGNMASHAG